MRRAVQVHVVRQIAHHAVGVAERERGVVGLVAHALRDAVEVDQARQVQLRADGATAVGEIDGGIPGLKRLDLDQRDHLLDLRQQGVLRAADGNRVTVELSGYVGARAGISTSVTPTEHTQSATICQDRGSLANRQV